MPRRKMVENPDGTRAPAPIERPEGITETQWANGKALGNISLALALDEVARGERPARDAHEAAALLDAATVLQTRALRTHAKLRSTIGRKLADSLDDYRAATRLTDAMLMIQDDPAYLVNGNSSA